MAVMERKPMRKVLPPLSWQIGLGILVAGLFLLTGCGPLSTPGEPLVSSATPTMTIEAPTEMATLSAGEVEPSMSTMTPTPTAAPSMQSNGHSYKPSVSADGRWVAFQSEASNLVDGDTNGLLDIFVYDRQTGAMERVSIASDGTQGNGESFSPAISADGRWVVFWSFASNLVTGDTEECGEGGYTYNCADIFVHDRQTGVTERIVAGGRRGLGGGSDKLGVSADGRWVVFYSWANNLIAGDTDGHSDVFVHDRQTGTTELISVANDGTQGNGDSVEPGISADGRWVVFVSWASNLVVGDTNEKPDVFVYDRQTGTMERVSVASDGTQGNGESGVILHQEGWSDGPSISADGRWVAFTSNASNLVPGDTNECDDPIIGPHNCYDVFVHDRQAGTTVRVSVGSDGAQSEDESGAPSISADGRWVVFVSSAGNLVAGDTNECLYSTGASNCPDIFVHDRQAGTTERVSVASNGTQADGISGAPSISRDGRWVVFHSWAGNLVAGDTNGYSDIFVYDRQTGTTELISVANDGTRGNEDSVEPSLRLTLTGASSSCWMRGTAPVMKCPVPIVMEVLLWEHRGYIGYHGWY